MLPLCMTSWFAPFVWLPVALCHLQVAHQSAGPCKHFWWTFWRANLYNRRVSTLSKSATLDDHRSNTKQVYRLDNTGAIVYPCLKQFTFTLMSTASISPFTLTLAIILSWKDRMMSITSSGISSFPEHARVLCVVQSHTASPSPQRGETSWLHALLPSPVVGLWWKSCLYSSPFVESALGFRELQLCQPL